MNEGRVSFVGGGLLVLAAWLAGGDWISPASRSIVERLPALVAAVSFVLAWRFRASRAALAAVAVAAASFLLQSGIVSPSPAAPAHALLAVLLPLDIAVLAPLVDRSLLTRGSGFYVLLLLLQAVAGSVLLGGPAGSTSHLLAVLATGQARLGALLLAAATVLLTMALRRGAIEAGLLWTTLAVAMATASSDPYRAATLMTVAEVVLLLAVVETSYRLAYHDSLTGLPGRRALDEMLGRLHGSWAVAMVDVDHFKKFNDRHGHDAGDQVLRMVGAQLARVGGGGRAFRYGGEEFALVFSGRDPAVAARLVDDVRAVIAATPFVIRSPDRPAKKPRSPQRSDGRARGVTVTVSAGVAGPGSGRDDGSDVLKAADRALYRAKRAGRNRVEVGR